jgi:hypothetical protein
MTTRRTRKGTVRENKDGSKTYVYERNERDESTRSGQKAKDRGVAVTYHPDRKKGKQHTSTSSAKDKKQQETGRKIPRSQHVAHKKGTSRTDTDASKTTIQSARKNIGDGNRDRKKRSR